MPHDFLEDRTKEESAKPIFSRRSRSTCDLFEHCRRAIEKATTSGPHGLPLIGTGDWNDGMSSVGDEGKGESVWLAWFLVDVLKKFAEVCANRGEQELASRYRDRAGA
jgi:cellobiose phosphorylase